MRNRPAKKRAWKNVLLSTSAALCLFACTPKKDPRHGRIVPTAPIAPTNLNVTNGDGFATISWGSPLYANRYHLFFGSSSGAYTEVVRNVTPPFTFGGLVNGENTYVVVQAEGDLGASPNSAEMTLSPANGTGSADTFFDKQWHLDNTGQVGDNGAAAAVGEDANVTWPCVPAATCRGEGVRVAVVDGGVEIDHEDLKANVAVGKSYNYLDATSDPTEPSTDDTFGHGTAVAGIIAARDLNDKGVRGVAPRANIVGYNMLQSSTDEDIADSLTRNASSISVSNNSWGPSDSYAGCPIDWGTTLSTPIETGITTGRGGKGTIYVFAAGNDDSGTSDCPTCQGNANLTRTNSLPGVITVGAFNAQGSKSTYSNTGANLVVSAPGGEFCSSSGSTGSLSIATTDKAGTKGINGQIAYTTDLSNKAYTRCMNGTSSAAPVVSGVVALLIQANPNLTYRDVRNILATTARQLDALDPDWITNADAKKFNPKYGHGAVDATAAVTAAATWTNLASQVTKTCSTTTVGSSIPENGVGITSDCTIGAGITHIEYVEVTFTATHTKPTDLEISLTNLTTGTSTVLVPGYNSPVGTSCAGLYDYAAFTMGAEAFLGESPTGNWRITVKDPRLNTKTGTFTSWSMKVYGY